MTTQLRMQVRAFEVTDEHQGSSVLIKTDDSLDIKFRTGDVLLGDSTGDHPRVAIALGIDGGPVDRIDILPGRIGIYDALLMAQDALGLALKGWGVANDGPIE